jgi:N utilization substance protein A
MIEKLEEAGISSLEKLASMTPEQLMEIPGIGEKMVDKIYQAVNRFYEGGDAAAAATAEVVEGGAVEAGAEVASETELNSADNQAVGETESAGAAHATDESATEVNNVVESETESASEERSEAAETTERETPSEQQEEKSS